MRIIALEQELMEMFEGRTQGPERVELVEIEQLLVWLHRCQRHPVEWKQQDDDDDRERQIKRHQPSRQRLQVAHALAVIVLCRRRRGARQHGLEVDGSGGQISHYSLPAATS